MMVQLLWCSGSDLLRENTSLKTLGLSLNRYASNTYFCDERLSIKEFNFVTIQVSPQSSWEALEQGLLLSRY